MSPEAQIVIQGLLFLVLTVVGLLLVWLHFRLNELLISRKKMPELADNLTEVMLKARGSIAQLMTGVREQVPDLEKKMVEAQKVLQEFDYVMDRAEKVLQKFDDKVAAPPKNTVTNEKLAEPTLEQKQFEATPLIADDAKVVEPKPAKNPDLTNVTPLRPAVAAAYGGLVGTSASSEESEAAPRQDVASAYTQSDAEDELRRALAQRL